MGKYFSAFPVTVYANTACLDITHTTHLTKQAINTSSLYYQLPVDEGAYPDMVADHIYDNPFYDWVVYYSNQVVDPYYDWPLTTTLLDSYIKDKYGSVAKAIEHTLHYRVNWYADRTRISKQQYQSMGASHRKYWRQETPDEIAYVRKEMDHKVSTNMIVKLSVDDTTVFTTGAYIHQIENGIVVASGEVMFVGSGYINAQHIEGEFTTDHPIINVDSDTQTSMTLGTTQEVISYVIPLDESVYWEKVNAYDYEIETNENKKMINLLNKKYLRMVEEEHQAKMVSNG